MMRAGCDYIHSREAGHDDRAEDAGLVHRSRIGVRVDRRNAGYLSTRPEMECRQSRWRRQAIDRCRRARRSGEPEFPGNLVFFAAAVLAVEFAYRNSGSTALGAQIYFWARVAYWPIYAVGIPYLRTVVWAIAFWGLLQVLEGLF